MMFTFRCHVCGGVPNGPCGEDCRCEMNTVSDSWIRTHDPDAVRMDMIKELKNKRIQAVRECELAHLKIKEITAQINELSGHGQR